MGSTTLIDLRGPERNRSPSGGDPPEGDEPVKLYTPRRQIYPQLAAGKIRTIKWIVLIASLAIYYVLPWLRWDYGVGAPNQAVLADFAGGRFYFFGLTLWPQEVYYITGLLILAALGLFLVTALFGRVWCGYACPQTVWTDLFIAVERLFEGDRNARMRLDKAPWSLDKAWRKIGKHATWLLIAFATGGAWILYWHDAPSLAATFFNGHAPATAYVFAGLLTFTTYALAGTMREQVCTYMCPWPRIQAALTDKTTLTVTYRSDRGEPRGAHKKGDLWEGRVQWASTSVTALSSNALPAASASMPAIASCARSAAQQALSPTTLTTMSCDGRKNVAPRPSSRSAPGRCFIWLCLASLRG